MTGWDKARANTQESGLGRTIAVGMYPHGASPTGVYDLAGNVAKWCMNQHGEPRHKLAEANASRAVRGGTWGGNSDYARCDYRSDYEPVCRFDYLTFRLLCVSPAKIPKRSRKKRVRCGYARQPVGQQSLSTIF